MFSLYAHFHSDRCHFYNVVCNRIAAQEFSNYAVVKQKRFIYEAGRTYGNLQRRQEHVINAIAKAVLIKVGGLRLRLASG